MGSALSPKRASLSADYERVTALSEGSSNEQRGPHSLMRPLYLRCGALVRRGSSGGECAAPEHPLHLFADALGFVDQSADFLDVKWFVDDPIDSAFFHLLLVELGCPAGHQDH